MAEWTPDSLYRSALRGGSAKPFWFCGPCAVEHRDVMAPIAETLVRLRDRFDVCVVFKASFDKANRTSGDGFRGPGADAGLRELEWVRSQFGLPIVTDVHESSQVAAVAEVADVLQIPAFLCRQTDLLVAAARTGKPVNVKKGQFIAPANARSIVEKIRKAGNDRVFLTERGVAFGYQRLVVDFAAWPELEQAKAPLVMDVTHAVQLPGGAGESTGGIREAIPYLARAAAAAGVSGFFAETHPDPSKARSDGPNAWPLDRLETLFESVYRVAEAAHGAPGGKR